MPKSEIITVVFDLDGTLVDTAADMVDALNETLSLFSSRRVDRIDIVPLVGGGLASLLVKAYAMLRIDRSSAAVEHDVKHLIERYSEQPARHAQLYVGVREVLQDLRAEDARLAVCTNKLEPIGASILSQLGIADMFNAVVGGAQGRKPKPDPEPLLEAIRKAGGSLQTAVMVGDSETDVLTARAAGVPIILVEHGYSSLTLTELKPDRIIASFAELPLAIREILKLRGPNVLTY